MKNLAARWGFSAENNAAGERIFNILKQGGVLTVDHTPFGRTEDNHIDFRGYPAYRTLVRNVTVKDADLSYANFSSSRLEGNYFENCVFVQADFSDASDHGDTFERCVFLKCTFKLAVIGYDGSQFRNCLFRESGFQKTNFIRGEFVHTDFVNSRLRGIDFSASSFEDCNFEGLLDNVWFRGTFAYGLQVKEFGQPKLNTMLNVSSENADLRNLTFSNGCDLSTVKVKNNGRYFKYDDWYQRLQFLSKEMELWDDQKQRNEAAKFLKVSMVHAATQDWEILNLDDWEDFYGGREVISKIVESLNRFTNS